MVTIFLLQGSFTERIERKSRQYFCVSTQRRESRILGSRALLHVPVVTKADNVFNINTLSVAFAVADRGFMKRAYFAKLGDLRKLIRTEDTDNADFRFIRMLAWQNARRNG